ncbi:hypothetical protein KTU01_21320 [Kocuria turfanensis]|uniref:Uncharacterized protein n=1 Tax=Kocuria turfanensis TaxID=388357 RepID=A0A512IE86_9MICC|nr:hypothetical protein KTU01_21320 [Kocuria turfanensis]
MPGDEVDGRVREEGDERGALRAEHLRAGAAQHEPRERGPVLGGPQVPGGLEQLPARREPGRGPPVQLLPALGGLGPEPVAQQVPEELVAAVPLAPVVEGDDEQVRPREPAQQQAAVRAAGEGVGQVPEIRWTTQVSSRNPVSSGSWPSRTSCTK